jgi:photoactive yellow protein
MPERDPIAFSSPDLFATLAAMSDAERDHLPFGVIGFDADTMVRQYNTFESDAAGLGMARVVGQPLFTVVAPCMNNFMVAQRFEDAIESNAALDATIDYVLTLRMRPVKVALRLLAAPGAAIRYVLVQRHQ